MKVAIFLLQNPTPLDPDFFVSFAIISTMKLALTCDRIGYNDFLGGTI